MSTPVPGPSAVDPDDVPAGPPSEDIAAAEPPKQRRRWSRGQLVALVAGALVLGIAGGGGIGYAIQAGRPPTPLPPLVGAQPRYPAARGAAPALTASEDDAVRTDGDLTALLVPAPSGSKPWDVPDTPDGWLSLSSYANGYTNPGSEFRYLLTNGFRRAAEVQWVQNGDQSVSVRLVQFQKSDESQLRTAMEGQLSFSATDTGVSPAIVPGTSDSGVYAGTKSHGDGNGGSYYQGVGYARHGDIMVEIFADSPNSVPQSVVMSIMQSQLERL
ncbi:hypothetical protein [Streptacidiphilus sp. MAP5-3]|uniref:hypothetical protein n=1 Tax=unclassified Streptacidiphilus TaxID=2643834 RepID=UPI0035111F8C